MDHNEETYEDFTQRYRAENGQSAQGPRVTAINKQLIIMLVGGAIFYAFFSFIGSSMDRAVDAGHAAKSGARQTSNPWAKD